MKPTPGQPLESYLGEHFIRVFDAAPVGMAVCTTDARFAYANRALQEFLERGLDELRDLTVSEVTFAADLEPTATALRSICRGEADSLQLEKRYVTKSGAVKWGQVSVFAERDGRGQTLFLTVLVQDINERKVAEENLRLSERKYRELAESLPQTLFETDRLGNFTYANSNGYQTFGYTKDDELSAHNIADLLVPEERPRAFQRFARLLQGERMEAIEYRARRRDGSTFPVVVYSTPVHQGDRIIGMRGILLDVSERKREEEEARRLREKLRQAEKMEAIGQLAGGIAHDFNNQLIAILGYADLLRGKAAGQDELERYAAAIIAGAQRASDLTGQLLTFSRKSEYRRLPVNLNAVVTELLTLLERSLDKRIVLNADLGDRAPIVEGDPTLLQGALLNLAINARDAMPHGGRALFSTRVVSLTPEACARLSPDLEAGEYAQVSLTDTGEGMDEATLTRIFEPFFTTKESQAGTGMGLATVYGTVRSHGGVVEVTSTPGQGSTFSLYLPLRREQDVLGPAEDKEEQMSTASGKALVIDDEEVARDVVVDMLEALGFEALAFESAADALAVYPEIRVDVDVVILDMVMPEMSGLEAFRELRALDPTVKVIIISGHSRQGEVEQVLREGAKGFLQKPFASAQLRDAIETSNA